MAVSHNDVKSINTTSTGMATSQPQTFEEMACSKTSTVKQVEIAINIYHKSNSSNYNPLVPILIAAARHGNMDVVVWVKAQILGNKKTNYFITEETIVSDSYFTGVILQALAESIIHNHTAIYYFLFPLVKNKINGDIRQPDDWPMKTTRGYVHLIEVAIYQKNYPLMDHLLLNGAYVKDNNVDFGVLLNALGHDQIIRRLQSAGLDLLMRHENIFAKLMSYEQYRNDILVLNKTFKPNITNLIALLEHKMDDYLLTKLDQFKLDDIRIAEVKATTNLKYLLKYIVTTKEYQNAKAKQRKISPIIFSYFQDQWKQTAAKLRAVSSSIPQKYLNEITKIEKQDRIVIADSKIQATSSAKDAKEQANALSPLLDKYSKDAKSNVKDIQDICEIQYSTRELPEKTILSSIAYNAANANNVAILQWAFRDTHDFELIYDLVYPLLLMRSAQKDAIDFLLNIMQSAERKRLYNYLAYSPHNKGIPILHLLIELDDQLRLQSIMSYLGTHLHHESFRAIFQLALIRNRIECLKIIATHAKKIPNTYTLTRLVAVAAKSNKDEFLDHVFVPTIPGLSCILVANKKFNYLNKFAFQIVDDEFIKSLADIKTYDQYYYDWKRDYNGKLAYSEIPPATIALFKCVAAERELRALDKNLPHEIHMQWVNKWLSAVHEVVSYSAELADHFPRICKIWLEYQENVFNSKTIAQLESLLFEEHSNPCISYFLCKKYFAKNDFNNAKKHFKLASPLFTNEFSDEFKKTCFIAPSNPPAVVPSIKAEVADVKAVNIVASIPPTIAAIPATISATADSALSPTKTVVVIRLEGEPNNEIAPTPIAPPGGASITSTISLTDVKSEATNPYRFLAPPASIPAAAQPDYLNSLDNLMNAITSGTLNDPTQLALLQTRIVMLDAVIKAKLSPLTPSAPEAEGFSSLSPS